MFAFLHASTTRRDGGKDTFWTLEVPIKISMLEWQKRGLSYTATGYGAKIPTQYMVQFNGKWRRVYCRIYSNNGTCFIGKLQPVGENIIVDIRTDCH